MSGRWTWSAAMALAMVLAGSGALVDRLAGRTRLRLEVGQADGTLLDGAWGRGLRLSVDQQATTDGHRSFYVRPAFTGAAVTWPVESRGPLTVHLRTRAVVRSNVSVYVDRRPGGQVLVDPQLFGPLTVSIPSRPEGFQPVGLELALRGMPQARGEHGRNAEIQVDWIEVEADAVRLSRRGAILLALPVLAAFLVGAALGRDPRAAAAASAAGALLAAGWAWASPLTAIAALPRLVPVALSATAITALACRGVGAGTRGRLAALVLVGTVWHGAVAFAPNHNPPDLETHVGRIHDFAAVPFEYQALLAYGSHLPTASQTSAPATDLFGSQAMVPYSPLPNFVFYAASRLGLDLHWFVTVMVAALAMLVVVPLFLAARRAWDEPTAWLAVALYVFELATWHHVGRAHAPSSFGQALGTTGLCTLLLAIPRLRETRARLAVAGVLALSVLGYTSLVMLVGLFGVAMIVLLLVDARALDPPQKVGIAVALAGGGLLALALYYGHYVPGILGHGGSIEAEPETFSGRTVLGILRNEGRQSYRIWLLGFTYPAIAGLLAAGPALTRARGDTRPVLVAWLVAWALILVLKDPILFPKMLRWAKEDQFVAPLLALFIAAAALGLPRRWMRVAAGSAAVAGYAFLGIRDYLFHTDTLW